MSIELEWSKPSATYGELLGYRLRHGVKDQALKEEFFKGTAKNSHSFTDLGKNNILMRKLGKLVLQLLGYLQACSKVLSYL